MGGAIWPTVVVHSRATIDRITRVNDGAITIVYDGDGNRVAQTAGGVTTRYLVDDRNPTGYAQVVEELVNGQVQRTYTYGHDLISQRQLTAGIWTTSFYGYDSLGSVRLLTDGSGAVTDQYTYDAFGAAMTTQGTTPNVYRFTGEQFDANLGLYYLRARYYNMDSGRFQSLDTYSGRVNEPLTLHKYLYAYADPINITDPSGQVGLAGYAKAYKPSILARAWVWVVGLAVACVYRLTTSVVATALEIAILGGRMKFSNLSNPCGVEREEKKTCDSPEYSGYVRCDAIQDRYPFEGNATVALGIARTIAGWELNLNLFDPKKLEKGPCSLTSGKVSGTHYLVRRSVYNSRTGQMDPVGRPLTSIGECECCDDKGGEPTIKKRCGFFGDHDPRFPGYIEP
jgi:RHS repeat-associated protein